MVDSVNAGRGLNLFAGRLAAGRVVCDTPAAGGATRRSGKKIGEKIEAALDSVGGCGLEQ